MVPANDALHLQGARIERQWAMEYCRCSGIGYGRQGQFLEQCTMPLNQKILEKIGEHNDAEE